MMSLLIEEYQRINRDLDKELETIYTQLAAFKKHAQYTQYDNELNQHLEHFSRGVLIKNRKYVSERSEGIL